jgi:PRTRC genetic system protein B
MTNVSNDFNQQYHPYKALLIYALKEINHDGQYGSADDNRQTYVESYDIGKHGNPINAHPLTLPEMIALSELFQSTSELKGYYLKSKGMIPGKVLYINPQSNGYAVWYTPPQEVDLFFVDGLNIPAGKAKIPAMVWKATKDSLNVYALKGKNKPTENTTLYHAPYFNIYESGNVCMGTVSIQIERFTYLEEFMAKWETYFFNSYFSHTIGGHTGSQIDMAELWRGQVGTGKPFPTETLVKQDTTLKRLMQ